MKVDFGQVIKTLDGQEMVEEDNKPVTLRTVCINALMAVFKDEDIAGEEKVKRYALAQRLYGGNNEVKAEEITLIKNLVGRAFAAGVVGPAYAMLEGE